MLRMRKREKFPNGLTVFCLDAGDARYLYHEIFEEEVYLKHGIAIEDGDCIFDVGANIGLFSLFANHRRQGLTVFAFEPIPEIFEVLKLNLSEECHIKTFNCGLAGESGMAEFYYYPHIPTISTMYPSRTDKILREYEDYTMRNPGELAAYWPAIALVPSILQFFCIKMLAKFYSKRWKVLCRLKTISEVLKETEVKKIDLLKIDVEFCEKDVLSGIAGDDWDRIRQIAMEVHGGEEPLAEVVNMVKSHDFEVYMEEDASLCGGIYMVYAIREIRGR